MNKVAIIYFSGTYNTLFISTIIKNKLMNKGFEVDTFSLDNEIKADFNKYDFILLGYPIHAYNCPKNYVKTIKKLDIKNKKYLIYKISGEPFKANNGSSYSLYKMMKRKKNELIGEYHFLMPYNILFETKEEMIRYEFDYNLKYIDCMISNLDNKQKYKVTIVERFISFFFKIQRIGCNINSHFYKVDKSKCIKCRQCYLNCPTHNIVYDRNKHKLVFHNKCIMCMRCSFYCPRDAISIGFLNKQRINNSYDLLEIIKKDNNYDINQEKDRFYKKFKPYFDKIDKLVNN